MHSNGIASETDTPLRRAATACADSPNERPKKNVDTQHHSGQQREDLPGSPEDQSSFRRWASSLSAAVRSPKEASANRKVHAETATDYEAAKTRATAAENGCPSNTSTGVPLSTEWGNAFEKSSTSKHQERSNVYSTTKSGASPAETRTSENASSPPPSSPSSPYGRRDSNASQSRKATDNNAGRSKQPSATGKARAPSSDGKEEGIGTPLSVESVEADSEVSQLRKLEQRLRNAMDAPLAERKRIMKELMFEYHPDKNHAPDAKEIFQFINASKSWFLTDNSSKDHS
jgi:hypothetical protein